MSGPFIVISDPGSSPDKAAAYAAWCADMFADVEEQEPRLLAFNQWESEDAHVLGRHPGTPRRGVVRVPPEAVRRAREADLRLHPPRGGRDLRPADPFVEQFISHGLEGVPVTPHPRHTVGLTRLAGA